VIWRKFKMLTCLYNGKVVNAVELSNDFLTLKEINLAGRRRELRCPDPECNGPVFFKQGVEIVSHFAHFSNPEGKCSFGRRERIRFNVKAFYTNIAA
jgi:competence CoiA-like predicted nuclease